MPKTMFFHEDDYCQIEIVPVENLEFCRKQAGIIDEFSEAHRSGAGFTDMYVREENPLSLYDKKITVAHLEQALAPILEKYDEVLTGYSSYQEKCENVGTFALNENIAVFYEFDAFFVKNIWLEVTPYKQEEADVAVDVFRALASLGDFIIADWGWRFVEKIGNTDLMKEYMDERLKVFSETE